MLLAIITYTVAFLVTVATYKCITRPSAYPRMVKKRGDDEDNTRDGFAIKKIPETVDCVIIGSGMGGLMCAGYLARLGKRVLVLEQHYIAGGCTHCFDEHEFTFETGLHYIGDVDRYSALLDVVASSKHPLSFAKLGMEEENDEEHKGTFDRFVIGRGADVRPFNMRAHHIIDDLVREFPEEEEAIRMWFRYCHQCMNTIGGVLVWQMLPQWLAKCCGRLLLGPYRRWAGRSAWDVVCEVTQNPRLRVILIGNCGDVGGPPDKSSFMMQAGVFTHYVDGAYYPVKGPQEIARSIIDTIEEAGGRVLVRAPVEAILLDDDDRRVRGVRVKGVEIRCETLVSGAGAYNTFKHLLPAKVVSESLGNVTALIDREGPSVAHAYAFVGLDSTAEELKLPSHNVWVLPVDTSNYDVLSDLRALERDPLGPDAPPWYMFIGCASRKDPHHTGKATVVVLCELPYTAVKEFDNTRQGARGEAYERLKDRIREKLVDEGLLHHYPQLRGHLEHVEIATPLSAKFFLQSQAGSSYGLGHSTARHSDEQFLRFLRAKTDIPGLYLTGQDTISSGIFPATLSGLVTGVVVGGVGGVGDWWRLTKFIVRILPSSVRGFLRAYNTNI